MSNRVSTCLLFIILVFVCLAGAGIGALLVARTPALMTWLTPTDLEPTVQPAPTTIPLPPTPNTSAPPVANIIDAEQRLIELYRSASPAVVNITTQVIRRDFFFGAMPESGSGSGFVWDVEGHILTNYHVIEGAQSIEVSFNEDQVLPAVVIGIDPPNDVAVIKVEALPEGVTPLPLGDSTTLAVGQVAVAIGNPFGQFQRTLTAGVISALDRTIEFEDNKVLRGVIQTDADINRGNSGGPLLDSEGRVIGITSAIFSPTGTNAGVGLAIPINKAKRLAPVLIAEGRYDHPWLGLEHLGYVISERLAQAVDLSVQEGLLIARIYRDSPANNAGIRPSTQEVIVGNRRIYVGGDILLAIDGIRLKNWEDLDAYLQERTEVGQQVTLEILREGQMLEIGVMVGSEPE